MKVLVIGAGGSEHALVWKLSKSKHVNEIYSSPGNAGITELAECVDLSPSNFSTIVDFVKYEWIDFTIVCAERLLAEGIVDFFEREGRGILGPLKKAAQVGSSRVFAKNLMRLHGIPTAEYRVFTSYLHAQDHIRLKGAPIVIKTDGRSEGGSFLASTTEQATNILKLIMEEKIFGDAGKYVIIEEHLSGERLSFIALTDGKTITPLTSVYIHRDDEKGLDAGGVGAYSPYKIAQEFEDQIMEKIMKPVLNAFHSEGISYKGFVSADLIVNEKKASVFELNCCLSDLESQTILPRLKSDFADVISAVTGERLSDAVVEMERNATVCIVAAAEAYPESHKAEAISGLEELKAMQDVVAFHENTSFSGSDIVTSGGRVIDITAAGNDLEDARTKAYRAIESIHFEGMHYRKDIGT